jgi:hypothetical protein
VQFPVDISFLVYNSYSFITDLKLLYNMVTLILN